MAISAPVQELQAIKQAVRMNPESIDAHASRIAELTDRIHSEETVVDDPVMTAGDTCKKH